METVIAVATVVTAIIGTIVFVFKMRGILFRTRLIRHQGNFATFRIDAKASRSNRVINRIICTNGYVGISEFGTDEKFRYNALFNHPPTSSSLPVSWLIPPDFGDDSFSSIFLTISSSVQTSSESRLIIRHNPITSTIKITLFTNTAI